MALLRGSTLGYHGSGAYNVADLPAGIVVGDLLVAIIADRYLPSMPVGWTSVHYASGANQSGRVAWKVVDGSDVASGTLTYILAGSGTGSVAVLAFEAGSYRSGSPVAAWTDSVAADINEAMPFLVINAGQAAYHFASARTAEPGTVVSLDGGALLANRTTDSDAASALYAEEVTSDTTVNVTWAATVASTGSYKASVIVADPPGTNTLPGFTGEANVLVAVYDVAPISPKPDDVLYTTAPTLTVLADGTPAPFQVQFQTSSDAGFSSTLWSQTLTNQYPGLVSATVGVALTPDVTSYWRARAGDGTSWGPWSSAQALHPLLERTNAMEYMHENVGAGLFLSEDAGEYLHANVGIAITFSAEAHEYLHENVGFQKVLDRRGGEYLHENAFVGVPTPHLWFAWLEYGFVNDHVFVYGQGLGTLMTEYNASMRIRDVNTGLDSTMSVFDWSVNPAGTHAYDELRKIYKGAGPETPPIVTQEADIVEVVIPVGIATQNTVIDLIFVVTDGGTSNQIGFTLYPKIPTPMATSAMTTRSTNVVRVVPYKVVQNPVPALYAAFAPQEVTVSGGMLEAPPEHLVSSLSTFTFVTSPPVADLEDPVGTPVPLGARWRPLTASITARPDLGTGASVWEPLSGSANLWRYDVGTDPYILETYAALSRSGVITRPAMIFPGDSWMQSVSPAPTSTDLRFTFVLVGTIFGVSNPDNAPGTILATTVPGGQPVDTYPVALELVSDTLYLKVGVDTNRNLGVPIPAAYLSKRPVIVAVTLDYGGSGTELVAGLTVLSDTARRVSGTIARPAPSSYLYLGRGELAGREARMDVLDVALGAPLALAAETQLISDLDGAYGVSGA